MSLSDDSKIRSLLARKPAPTVEPANKYDPKVIAFLDKIAATDTSNEELKAANETLQLEHDQDQGRIRLLQQELTRETKQRRSYEKAYAIQGAEIAILITAASAAQQDALAALASYRKQAKAAIDGAAEQSEAAISGAFDRFIKTSDASSRSIREALTAEGVDPHHQPAGVTTGPMQLSEDSMRKIASAFGADARPSQEVTDEQTSSNVPRT